MLGREKFVATTLSALILSGVLTGCQGSERQTSVQSGSFTIPEDVKPLLQDKFHDPIYRAGSLTLFTGDGSFGQGSLVRRNGKLYIYTIGHVADALKSENDSYVNIPGLLDPVKKLDAKDFHYHPKTVDYEDKIVSLELDSSVQKEIDIVVNKGEIAPLEVDKSSINDNSYISVPRPDVGKNTWLLFTGIMGSGAMELQIDSMGVICTGRSGGPVLRTFGQFVSRKLLGILSAAATNSKISDPQGVRDACFSKAIATPINDP